MGREGEYAEDRIDAYIGTDSGTWNKVSSFPFFLPSETGQARGGPAQTALQGEREGVQGEAAREGEAGHSPRRTQTPPA